MGGPSRCMPIIVPTGAEFDAAISGINNVLVQHTSGINNLITIISEQGVRISGLVFELNSIKSRVSAIEAISGKVPVHIHTSGSAPVSGAGFTETFSTSYVLADGQTSPDGRWKSIWNGGGRNECISGVMRLVPKISTATNGLETHSCLVLSTQKFGNFQLDVDMKTTKQLRLNYPPKNWETAWIGWRYFDSIHHYYFTLKRSGCELGKKDNVEGDSSLEKQLFIRTLGAPSVTIGSFQHITITMIDFKITVSVNGVKIMDLIDVPKNAPKMSNGSVWLYCEDSLAEFDNVKISPL